MAYETEQYATEKQKALLKSRGISEEKLRNLSKKEASSMIDQVLTEKGQNHGNGSKVELTQLLDVSDGIMEHVQRAEVYQSLSEELKLQAFKAILEAYAAGNE